MRFLAIASLTALFALALLPVVVEEGATPSTHARVESGPERNSFPTDLPGWRLTFVENFDSLDPARWNVRHESRDVDSARLQPQNVSVEDGWLRIQARKQWRDGRPYTSGDIDTYEKYSLPNYFRIKVRAKVPLEQGMWAAPLWLRPLDHSAGEIDLVETYGAERDNPSIHQTIHTEYGDSHRQLGYTYPFWALNGGPLGWHTYVLEKTPNRIAMSVDGVQTSTFTSYNPKWFDRYYEAGKRWTLRSNLQVGGWNGNPDRGTDWSPEKTAMLVDYIYAWVPV